MKLVGPMKLFFYKEIQHVSAFRFTTLLTRLRSGPGFASATCLVGLPTRMEVITGQDKSVTHYAVPRQYLSHRRRYPRRREIRYTIRFRSFSNTRRIRP
jgi:hypothetical protein